MKSRMKLCSSLCTRIVAILLSAAIFTPALLAETASTRPTSRPAFHPSPSTSPSVSLPSVPKSIADLKAIERRVEETTKKVMPSVVGISIGGSQGSGVIISKDGYVLTAGHVSSAPGIEVTLVLADGRRVKAKTLGVNSQIDSGLIKIDEEGEWPAAELGKSGDLKQGQWVIALGHPGGYRKDRPPVLRLGRILVAGGVDSFLMTDCTLVGGDSGGPLFDLDGKVVGIHSRIGNSTFNNMHVPVDTFTQTWDRLASSEIWGGAGGRGPMLGVAGETLDGKGARLSAVTPGGPGAKAGLKEGDVITQFDGRPVRSIDLMAVLIARKRPGDVVAIEVLRDGKTVALKATLARRPKES